MIFYFYSLLLLLLFYIFNQRFFLNLKSFTLINNVYIYLVCFMLLLLLVLYFWLISLDWIFIDLLLFNNHNFFYSASYNFLLLDLDYEFLTIILGPYLLLTFVITFISLLTILAFNNNEIFSFINIFILVIIFGLILLSTNSLLVFFLSYEIIVFPSFYILYKFGKSRKSIEASFLMFFWTQFGAFFLLFSILYIYLNLGITKFSILALLTLPKWELFLLYCFIFIGFSVKFPLWPFYDWLPKAHTEASTNFSIFLSGSLVKFAFFAFFKFLFYMSLNNLNIFFIPFILVGLIRSSFSIFMQVDIKKIIAFITVFEMHWLSLGLIIGNTNFWFVLVLMLIGHALISTLFFLIADMIARRFRTRLWTEIRGLIYLVPNLYFLVWAALVIFLGFPGSILFFAEIFFFIYLLDYGFIFIVLVIFLMQFVTSTFVFKHWFSLCFGLKLFSNFNNMQIKDIYLIEFFLGWSLVLLLFLLSLYFDSWIFF